MTAAVDHDVDLDEVAQAELMPPCDFLLGVPPIIALLFFGAIDRCAKPAVWIAKPTSDQCVCRHQWELLCDEHARAVTPTARCYHCGALLNVELERL